MRADVPGLPAAVPRVRQRVLTGTTHESNLAWRGLLRRGRGVSVTVIRSRVRVFPKAVLEVRDPCRKPVAAVMDFTCRPKSNTNIRCIVLVKKLRQGQPLNVFCLPLRDLLSAPPGVARRRAAVIVWSYGCIPSNAIGSSDRCSRSSTNNMSVAPTVSELATSARRTRSMGWPSHSNMKRLLGGAAAGNMLRSANWARERMSLSYVEHSRNTSPVRMPKPSRVTASCPACCAADRANGSGSRTVNSSLWEKRGCNSCLCVDSSSSWICTENVLLFTVDLQHSHEAPRKRLLLLIGRCLAFLW